MPTTMRNASLALVSALALGASIHVQAGPACSGLSCVFRGQLVEQHTTLRLSAPAFSSLLASNASGQQLAALAGTPVCNVDMVYLRYLTVGGAGEPTIASAALMIPGGSPACSGPRPLMMYAHGTTAYRNYNIADITQTDPGNGDGAGEGLAIAAMYAAQGYIVVASNYAGYAGSTLSYHPYLNGDQQAADMIDSLRAARTVLATSAAGRTTRENGKVFLSGYSQGGYVAMATHRAMQAAGMRVTAASTGSGPYAMAATADALIEGEVNLGSTLFTTLVVTSYQRAYGNIYRRPSEFYEANYAPGIENLLPNVKPLNTLFTTGKLPPTHLFSSTSPASQFDAMTPPLAPPLAPPVLTGLFAAGFGPGNLVRNAYRLRVLEDAAIHPDGAFPNATTAMLPAASPEEPLRQAFKRNDLRNWQPHVPVQLCGGQADPTVFFFNARIEQAYWSNANVPAALVTVLDVDSPIAGPGDVYAPIKQGFALAKATVASQAVAAGATDGGATAVLQAYHGSLVASFCTVAARAFFAQF